MYNTRPKPGTQRKELHHQHLGSAFGVSSPPPVLQPSAAPPCLWHPTLAAAPRSAGGSGLCSVVAMGTSAPSWVWGAGCLGGGRGGVDGSPTSCSIRCRSSWICCSRASQSCCTSWLCSATRLGGGRLGRSDCATWMLVWGPCVAHQTHRQPRGSFPQQGFIRHFGHGLCDCTGSPTPNTGTV